MSKSSKKAAPAKGQSSLFSFFKKKSSPEVLSTEVSTEVSQCESKAATNPSEIVSAIPSAAQKPEFVVVEDDKSVYVGRCVRVYWPNEKQWYSGEIKSYDVDENTHSIVYEDGDQEDLCLEREKVNSMHSAFAKCCVVHCWW